MADFSKQIEAKKAQLAAIDGRLAGLLANENMTSDQQQEAASLDSQSVAISKEIVSINDMAQKFAAIEDRRIAADTAQANADHLKKKNERQITPEPRRLTADDTATGFAGSSVEVGKLSVVRNDAIADNWGFASFGEFAREVAVSRKNQQTPTRIINGFNQAASMAAQGMGEAIGADGGFLVPQQFVMKIFEKVYAEGNLLSRTDIYNISSNTISFPRSGETSRATGSRWGGVQAYWRGEGSSPTTTKPSFGMLKLTLHKLIAMGVATEDLLEDSATALDQYLTTCFTREIDFTVSDSLINGTGAGMPLGVLNAACTVSVAKESGQSAATINATNLIKMHARLWSGCRQNAVWFINQDIEPQLHTLQIGTGVANQLVYMPPGGLSGLPYATLLGKPVIPVEYCATLGTVGDIILADLSQWVTAVKSGGPKSAVSMHLYFNTDEQAFRVTYRLDSQPWWPAAVTPYKGSNTQSCAVTLATRA